MKPILFSTSMVQAILDGRKTMTRRVIKPQPTYELRLIDGPSYKNEFHEILPNEKADPVTFSTIGARYMPKYQPGDVLWVRETWAEPLNDFGNYVYKASCWDDIVSQVKWRSPITMPREAARLFLKVTDVRVERVQDISTSDCEREGITSDIERFNGHMIPHHDWIVGEFSKLWDSINAKRGYGWDSNPWVWVYSFKRIGNPGVDA